MSKYKVGDTILLPFITDVFEVSQVDLVGQTYTLKDQYGVVIIPISTIDKDATLVTSKPTPLTTPPVFKAPDPYIGKKFKVREVIGTAYTTYKVGEILEVACKSKMFLGEYELERPNKIDKFVFACHPNSYTWNVCLKEYIEPKCTCGLNKVWMDIHKRLPPKDSHYDYCDILKEK